MVPRPPLALGFGPFPIIFSTNLFMWFMDDWFIFQFLMIATGALAKEFIQWDRAGRKCHIFNPSAFGLALFSLGLLVTGTSRYTWGLEIATTLARPHFIYLEIFLVGLIVQGFFGVTLVTLSATATLCISNLIYTHFAGAYFSSMRTSPLLSSSAFISSSRHRHVPTLEYRQGSLRHRLRPRHLDYLRHPAPFRLA